MFNNDNLNDNYGSYDDLYTKIDKFIPKNKIIYEPFYLDGKSGECLKNMGCKKVIHEDIDFFTNVDKIEYEIICSNPPFSKRKLIFGIKVEIGFLNVSNININAINDIIKTKILFNVLIFSFFLLTVEVIVLYSLEYSESVFCFLTGFLIFLFSNIFFFKLSVAIFSVFFL